MGKAERGNDRALVAVRDSGLVREGAPLLVLLSGGADSTCLLDIARRLDAELSALHVNYGLRSGADADEAHCHDLCASLGVPLTVERVELPEGGNLQAQARDRRYALAEGHATGDYATGHTATDQAETIVYRLAVSPGRRALLGMAARRDRLVRPLLEATRDDTLAYCRARGLAWREDPSNADPRFARSRVRHELLPVLRAFNPAAEATIAATGAMLRDEAEVLDTLVDQALKSLGTLAVSLVELRAYPAGLGRLLLRRLAETASGRGVALSRRESEALLSLGADGGSASLDLGGGLKAVAEYGVLRFTTQPEPDAPEPVGLAIPGRARFGSWEVEARPASGGRALARDPESDGEAALSAAALGTSVTIRAWRSGDRMRPAGLGGTKSLQDLFTDRKVPRALRRSLPIVEADGEVAWVAGVALGERFRPTVGSGDVVSLSARRSSDPPPDP